MSTFPPPPPLSPGVGARRKGPKQLPRLPLSVFTPPNSGTSDKFPLLPSPSAIHPKKILDANVRVANNDLQHWANDTELGTKTGGVVAILSSSDNVARYCAHLLLSADIVLNEFHSIAEIASVAAVSIPLDLSDVNPPTIPPSINTHFTLAFQGNLLTDDQIRRLAAVVESGHSVDIDVQADFANGEAVWESLEDLLARATAKFQGSTRASFVICEQMEIFFPLYFNTEWNRISERPPPSSFPGPTHRETTFRSVLHFIPKPYLNRLPIPKCMRKIRRANLGSPYSKILENGG